MTNAQAATMPDDRCLLVPPTMLQGVFDGVPLHALLGVRLAGMSSDSLMARVPFRRELSDGVRDGGAPLAVILAAIEALATFHAGLEIAQAGDPALAAARFTALRNLAPRTVRLNVLSSAPRRDVFLETTVRRRSRTRLQLHAAARCATGAALAEADLAYDGTARYAPTKAR